MCTPCRFGVGPNLLWSRRFGIAVENEKKERNEKEREGKWSEKTKTCDVILFIFMECNSGVCNYVCLCMWRERERDVVRKECTCMYESVECMW